jgi:uncharacterized protein YciI
MEPKYFAIKLIPNRPSFAQDMTDAERAIMRQHVDYWKTFLATGEMIIFGPVLDPAATYGLGIVKVDSEERLQALLSNDPAGKINRYEYHPMLAVTAIR